MHGIITSYDSRKGAGWIQGDDGQIYDFRRQDLQKAEDEAYLRTDTQVDFQGAATPNADGKKQALNLLVLNPQDCAEKVYYREPENLPTYTEDFVDGYDILDRGLYRLERKDRTEEKALRRLRYDCEQVHANAIVGYKVTTELKNAFGNGFNLYIASGVPVIMGKIAADGECTAEELKRRMDHEKVKKLHSAIVNSRIAKLVFKGVAAVLLVIFALGFILTGGV